MNLRPKSHIRVREQDSDSDSESLPKKRQKTPPVDLGNPNYVRNSELLKSMLRKYLLNCNADVFECPMLVEKATEYLQFRFKMFNRIADKCIELQDRIPEKYRLKFDDAQETLCTNVTSDLIQLFSSASFNVSPHADIGKSVNDMILESHNTVRVYLKLVTKMQMAVWEIRNMHEEMTTLSETCSLE